MHPPGSSSDICYPSFPVPSSTGGYSSLFGALTFDYHVIVPPPSATQINVDTAKLLCRVTYVFNGSV